MKVNSLHVRVDGMKWDWMKREERWDEIKKHPYIIKYTHTIIYPRRLVTLFYCIPPSLNQILLLFFFPFLVTLLATCLHRVTWVGQFDWLDLIDWTGGEERIAHKGDRVEYYQGMMGKIYIYYIILYKLLLNRNTLVALSSLLLPDYPVPI